MRTREGFIKKDILKLIEQNGFKLTNIFDKNDYVEVWTKEFPDTTKYELSFVYDKDGKHSFDITMVDNAGEIQYNNMYAIRNIKSLLRKHKVL
jgi:hypothetical protein